MKKYIAPSRLQLVGKAWEIRHALRQEKKLRNGGNITLIDLLSFGQQGPTAKIGK
ncbi:Z-ring formation inhibitor MciZ [Cohnella herbarum]|uniref:Z-ring formation inhibitor MciZ n=1 Tax=Cohnella herbarum TaxID=2728023 RepID=A0A7Z2VRR4_9BACL|nr:Z-ring formation inhibitor MciZ [Cohnella herbarum]QJD87961.1 Z-ring formation inhibitor MciZ [Cohnella herbarum]